MPLSLGWGVTEILSVGVQAQASLSLSVRQRFGVVTLSSSQLAIVKRYDLAQD